MTTRSRLLSGALFAALLLPASAFAGNLQVRDPGDVLPAQDEASLRADARAWPFDARVVVTTDMSSRADFDRYVGQQVGSANMVVVGVDPAHRHTSVHFGTGTRIARDRFGAIENAGDQWFRQGQWRTGVEAILSSANSAVGSGSPLAAGDERARGNEGAPAFPWGLMLLGIGGVAVAVMVFRAARSRAQLGGGGYPGVDPYRAQQYPPGYNPGPNYGPGYGPQPGIGGLGAGILGAGVGGLAGYALGSAMAHREDERYGGGDHNVGGSGDNGTPDFDAGGGSSDWGDGGGGGDIGGGDSGGGGGDW